MKRLKRIRNFFFRGIRLVILFLLSIIGLAGLGLFLAAEFLKDLVMDLLGLSEEAKENKNRRIVHGSFQEVP